METFYSILIGIHIFSAILGIGPGFTLIPVVKSAKTMSELRHAFLIKKQIHFFITIGGTFLLLSGLAMGAINPSLFRMGWYLTSLILFLIALAMGPVVLAPVTKPLKALIAEYKDEDIPKQIEASLKIMYKYEVILDCIFVVIIGLMIVKPF